MWMFQTSKALWLLINLIVQCSSNLHPGFSRLEHGHRLDGSVINSFPEFSFLDCVTECLVTPRCTSVNYFKGANFCELNYERKQTAYIKFTESPGWVNSEKDRSKAFFEVSLFYGQYCICPCNFYFKGPSTSLAAYISCMLCNICTSQH